ncbi:MAG TPA: hypothetical protein VF363_05800 [Candidatus Eisenbacteria bacterium]
MTPVAPLRALVIGAMLAAAGCGRAAHEAASVAAPDLAGAWRSAVRFHSGAFALIKDLEFLYSINAGGTMTESSNYDGAPPVPPAYGVWRRLGPREFEAHYEFFVTKAPATVGEITGGGGWLPAGRGVLVERFTLSEDGNSFASKIRYDAYDVGGKPAAGGGEAEGNGTRIQLRRTE